MTKEKPKRELIGFQIASADYSERPDEFPSFEVLTASMVEEFFKRVGPESGWVAHPIYEGDVHEPWINKGSE